MAGRAGSPRREKRKTITDRRAGAGIGTPMAFLASRRLRSHGGAEPSLLPIRTRETALCHRALRQGDESSLRGPGTTPREEPLRRRRRLLDRGHCHLSLDRTVGNATAKPRRLSGPEALVRGHRLATVDPSRVLSEGRI